jgi:hypothetical protein
VKTLVDRSAYDEDPTAFMARMPWVAGVFFGLWMGLFDFISSADESLLSRWATSALLGTLMGLFFGAFVTWCFRFLFRRIADRIYRGDPSLVAPPPEGYSARLPCSRWIRPQRAVPGVLYLGAIGGVFLPLIRFRSKGQFALSAQDLAVATITSRIVPQSWLERRLSLRPPEALILTVPAGEFVLLVPRTATTMAAIRQELLVLATRPGAGAA